MDFNQVLRNYSAQPIPHQLLISLLKEYKRPNDKINYLKEHGILLPVKKGLYIAGENLHAQKPDLNILANQIYGPSYVSMDSALSIHGIIPERVFEISSMTTKPAKNFQTPVGRFTYSCLPVPYYSFGLQQFKFENHYAIIASPEKALCDKIINSSGILLRSIARAERYILENLRMDEYALKQMDIKKIRSWVNEAPKKESLLMVTKMIEKL